MRRANLILTCFALTSSFIMAGPVETLPFKMDRTLIFLDVGIKGAGTVQVALDTGASMTVLDTRSAERLGLAFRDAPGGMAYGAGGQVDLKFLKEPVTFVLGGIELTMDHSPVLSLDGPARSMGRRLDGVLGYNLFQKYVVEIDYVSRKVHLHDRESYEPHENDVLLPIELHHGIPSVKAAVTTTDGRRLEGKFHIDTGASSTVVLNQHFAEKNKALQPEDPRISLSAGGVGVRFNNEMARLGKLEMAGFILDKPVAMYSHAEDGPLASKTMAGVIGGPMLKRFNVTVDVTRDRILLRKNEIFAEPDPFVDSGMRLIAEGEEMDEYRVLEVIEGSPASEKGVKAGDLVVAFDGKSASDITMPEIREALRDEGRESRVRLKRGEEELVITLIPIGLI